MTHLQSISPVVGKAKPSETEQHQADRTQMERFICVTLTNVETLGLHLQMEVSKLKVNVTCFIEMSNRSWSYCQLYVSIRQLVGVVKMYQICFKSKHRKCWFKTLILQDFCLSLCHLPDLQNYIQAALKFTSDWKAADSSGFRVVFLLRLLLQDSELHLSLFWTPRGVFLFTCQSELSGEFESFLFIHWLLKGAVCSLGEEVLM